MRKIFITLQLVFSVGVVSVKAQNLYQMGTSWIDLETFAKADSATTPESDFKKTSKYAARFRVFDIGINPPQQCEYKERPFRVIDDNHIGYKVSPGSKEVKLQTNSEEETLEKVGGNHFVVSIPDGVVNVQRFSGPSGYRVAKYDEWAKLQFKQNIPHTLTAEKGGKEFTVPYLYYFMHTDRFMLFTSLNTRTVHKSVLVDLKDGKTTPIESTVCGVIRADNEIAIKGYVLRDEAAKTLTFKSAMGSWAIKENNITKVITETVVNDTAIIFARYYKGSPTVSLASCSAKTGKVVWVGEVKQPAAGANQIFLSVYKGKLIMEGTQNDGGFLEAFDMTNGKRLYSTIQ